MQTPHNPIQIKHPIQHSPPASTALLIFISCSFLCQLIHPRQSIPNCNPSQRNSPCPNKRRPSKQPPKGLLWRCPPLNHAVETIPCPSKATLLFLRLPVGASAKACPFRIRGILNGSDLGFDFTGNEDEGGGGGGEGSGGYDTDAGGVGEDVGGGGEGEDFGLGWRWGIKCWTVC